jgi:diguanylate cyclase (GGDEF)-like protein/PAS domain S-box-containing protein
MKAQPELQQVSRPGNISSGLIARNVLVACALIVVYLLLSRPEVILISNLGFTAWYPAVGLVFAVMLGLSPRYMPLFVVADALSSLIIYHQSGRSWGVLPAALFGTTAYAIAAQLLQSKVKIDRTLSHLSDVARYLTVTLTAGIFATIAGVGCLAADGTIKPGQFWEAAVAWYIGDATGLLSVAPFLLIYILPAIRRNFSQQPSPRLHETVKLGAQSQLVELLEATAQAISIILLLWIMFGRLAPKQYFYLAFVPIIWIAMRKGMAGVVVGLLALNFGIVVALRISPAPPDILTKIGFLMLVVSATGLIVGSAVTERRRVGEELSERTTFLNSLVENSPFAIVVQDLSGTVELCNDAFATLYGYKIPEVVGRNLVELIVPPEQHKESRQLISRVNSGEEAHQTLSRQRKDGQMIDVETHAIPMLHRGRVSGAYIIYKDISLQVRAATAAAEHARSLNQLVDELKTRSNEMTLLNEMGSLLQSSVAAEEIFAVVGASSKKIFTNSHAGALFLFKSSRNVLELATSWGDEDHIEKQFVPGACWSLRRGQPHWSESAHEAVRCTHLTEFTPGKYLCVSLIAQGDTLGVLQLGYPPPTVDNARKFDESSEQRLGMAAASQMALSLASLRLRESLRDQSIRDPLTGLFNRRFMQECLDREMLRVTRKNRSLAVIFIDVDHFKRFNDMFGHEAGDHILRSLGDLFKSHFRGDDVICRYGGEEFAIILPESNAQDAATRAEILRQAAKELKLMHHGITLNSVTISAGIAGYPEHTSTASELLSTADACLYEAKRKGRDRIIIATAATPRVPK